MQRIILHRNGKATQYLRPNIGENLLTDALIKYQTENKLSPAQMADLLVSTAATIMEQSLSQNEIVEADLAAKADLVKADFFAAIARHYSTELISRLS